MHKKTTARKIFRAVNLLFNYDFDELITLCVLFEK